ncbi:MAG: outer membrane beta-barrel protein [Akkermansiaceae bacterium]
MKGFQIKFPSTAMVLLALACGAPAVEGQVMVAGAGNSGFRAPPPNLVSGGSLGLGDGAEGALRDFSLSLASSLFYDTNAGQSPDTPEYPVQADLVLMLSPMVQWSRASKDWNFALSANGSYGENFNEDQYNTKNYGFNGSAGYRAGRLSLAGDVSQSFNEGSNRFYGGIVSQMDYGLGLSAAYEINPKTSLTSSFSSSWSQPDDSFGETESRSGNLSAMWRYSSLLRFGPGLGYGSSSGDLQTTRTTWGPTLSADYKLSNKVSLSARGGLDFVSYDGDDSGDGGSDHAFSTEINASYALNARCGMSLSLSRGVQADGSLEGSFREGTALRFSVNQKIGGKLTAAVGLGYEHSAYLTDSGMTPRPAVDFYTGDFTLSMPWWGDRASAATFIRYTGSVSDDPLQDWNGLQTGVSINLNF